eukprot:gene43466-53142_t
MAAVPMQIVSRDIDRYKFTFGNLEIMRSMFPDQSDETLARYLIARNNDVEKASTLLRGMVAWRSLYFPILKSSMPTEFPIGKIYVHGTDKEGRPLMVWQSRLNIAKDRDINEAGRLMLWWTEYVIRQLPPHMSKYTVLIDRSNFKRENSDLELVKHVTTRMQDCYPERLQRCIIFPSDLFFTALWNVGKWFLDPVTRDKVQPMLMFHGVQQFVDDKYIPKSMGGKSEFEYNGGVSFEDPYTPAEIARAASLP